MEGGADRTGKTGAGGGGGGLDAEDDDAGSAAGKKFGESTDGSGMGADVATLDGLRIETAEGSGRKAHVGGVQEDEKGGMEAADQAGEVFRHRFGIEASPIGMAEGSGEDRPEGVVAMAGIADAEEEVHGGMAGPEAGRRVGEQRGLRIMVFIKSIVWYL